MGAWIIPAVKAAAALIPAAASIWANMRANKNNNNTQLAVNRETIGFNREMFDKANLWNLSQWNRENDYNLPVNQMMRLKQAGINPNLFYSNGVGSLGSAPSASASPVTANLGASREIPIYNSADNPLLQNAQIELLNAQKEKTESETNINNVDLRFRDRLNSQILEEGNVRIHSLEAGTKLTDEQVKQCKANIDNLNASSENLLNSAKLINVQIDGAHLDNAMRRIDFIFKGPMYEATIAELVSKVGLNKAQAEAAVKNSIANMISAQAASKQADAAAQNAFNNERIVNRQVGMFSVDSCGKLIKLPGLLDLQYERDSLNNLKLRVDVKGYEFFTNGSQCDKTFEALNALSRFVSSAVEPIGTALGGFRPLIK